MPYAVTFFLEKIDLKNCPSFRFGNITAQIKSAPIIISIAWDGTLISPNPYLKNPMMKMEIIAPINLPFPPDVENPPSTTMEIASSSYPSAIFGLVLPILAVKNNAVTPANNPVSVNTINLIF